MFVHVYSIVWLLGWYASYVVLPHQLDDQVLRLRDGMLGDVVIPLTAVRKVRKTQLSNYFRSGFTFVDDRGRNAKFTHGDANVRIDLDPETTITVKRVPHHVASLAVTTDDPAVFITALTSQAALDQRSA